MEAAVMRLCAAATLGVRDARVVVSGGAQALADHWASLTTAERDRVERLHEDLTHRGIGLLLATDERYPARLRDLRSAPPYLFFRGDLTLLDKHGVGMCGSRNASERGLEAARLCGEELAHRSWHVISGYARGVDTETHIASLRAGAGTVIVLAEGILHFRRKRVFADVPFSDETVLVLSQFAPSQRWSAGAAMTRNGVIAALGAALIVVEAGERGGTLNAGEQALAMGRPVLALDFSAETPAGNRKLFEKGADAIRTRGELISQLHVLANGDGSGNASSGCTDDAGQQSLFTG